jgi:hypothetical protein
MYILHEATTNHQQKHNPTHVHLEPVVATDYGEVVETTATPGTEADATPGTEADATLSTEAETDSGAEADTGCIGNTMSARMS